MTQINEEGENQENEEEDLIGNKISNINNLKKKNVNDNNQIFFLI